MVWSFTDAVFFASLETGAQPVCQGLASSRIPCAPCFPGGSIPESVGGVLLSVLARAQPLLVTITPGAVQRPSFRPSSMADFSSWGPTSDGRVKPDIAAPGQCPPLHLGLSQISSP